MVLFSSLAMFPCHDVLTIGSNITVALYDHLLAADFTIRGQYPSFHGQLNKFIMHHRGEMGNNFASFLTRKPKGFMTKLSA